MRQSSRFWLSMACLLAMAGTSWASGSFPDKISAMGLGKPKCSDCHDGATKTEAAGGKFKGMGAWLLQQKKAKHADKVDPAWLKDYK